MREIELFQKLRGSDHIIAVLAEGEPVDSFPYAITHPVINGQEVEVEPLAADVRGETPAKQKHKMRVEQLRIVAAMLHCEFDQLRQREQQRQLQRGIAAGRRQLCCCLCFPCHVCKGEPEAAETGAEDPVCPVPICWQSIRIPLILRIT